MEGEKNYTNVRQRNSIPIGFFAMRWRILEPVLNSTLYLQWKIKKKRNDRSSPFANRFYKNLQMQRRRRVKDKMLVVSRQIEDEPFISVSVTLYLNCSFTSCAMKALSSVLIVVGPAWSLTSSAITALAFVLFFPLLTYNSDSAGDRREESQD